MCSTRHKGTRVSVSKEINSASTYVECSITFYAAKLTFRLSDLLTFCLAQLGRSIVWSRTVLAAVLRLDRVYKALLTCQQ